MTPDELAVTTKTFQFARFKMMVSRELAKEFIEDVRVGMEEALAEGMVRAVLTVFALKSGPKVEKSGSFYFQPTWWDHFKKECLWWIPWVRWKTDEIVIEFHHYHVCPHVHADRDKHAYFLYKLLMGEGEDVGV